MAQISYGTITINDITDINDVYLEYALALSGANVTNNYTFDNLGEISWSTTYPTWQSGYQIWIREVQEKEGIQQKEYKTPYLDTAVNQINNNYIGLDNKLKTFFYPGDSNYAGAFAVGHVDNLNVNNINTYGFNTRIQVGAISMGYNAIPLLEMGLLGNNFNGIKLYSPILSNQNIITGNRLDATLTSEGLKLIKGGIVAGSYDSIASDENQDFVYLSSENYGVGTKIGDSASDKADWRQIIGNKFGVDKAGNLYAAGAHINGDIIAQSLTIGSGANAYSGIAAINITGYSIEIEVADIAGSTETKKLIPHLLHNGENADAEVEDKTDFIWYVDNSTNGIQGDSVDGSIIGEYGSSYRVIYDFNDGAVGGGTATRTLTVDPTKYITRISDTGITIHPEMLTEQSSWIQLDGNGMELFNSSNESIARYGNTAKIGFDASSRFLMNASSLQAYNNNNQLYFEVNANGLTWGSNTAATTTQVNAAAQTASKYITAVDQNGIKVHAENNIDLNYTQITSDGMEIFKIDETTSSPSAVSVAKFGEITHVGSRNGTHLRVENNGLYLKDKALSIFQIKTEELDDGPEINLILYQNNNQLAAKERYSSGQSYLYRPKEVVIEFDDSSLSSGDTIDISTDFNGTASIYYNNQYNWVGLNGSGTLNITYGTSVNSLSYSQTISWQGTSRTITVFNLTYDGNNKIILETLTNSGASSDDASRYVRLNYYKNIKITASQQLSVLPATIIGPQELSHVEIDYHSLQMIDKEQNVYFYISDLRDEDGYGTVTDHFTGDGDTIYFPFSSTPASSVSVKVGGATKVYGTDYTYDRDIGVTFVTAPSNGLSVIINYKTTDSTLKAFTFGIREPDYGLGKYSVVEGYYCIASGIYSYATGLWTEATARCAHAEGAVTVANGAYSHAQNECTIASKTSQTVLGTFNVEDTATITTHPSGTISYGQYAIIVGNGTTSSARSNALTVDWQGNVEAAGEVAGVVHTYGAITGGTWSSKSIGTGGTWKELANFTIPEDGVWLLIAELIYASNATGHRTMSIATSSATAGVGIYSDRRQAINGTETPLRVVAVVQGNTKYYVNTYHGASTAISCQGRYTAFKIGNGVNKIGG